MVNSCKLIFLLWLRFVHSAFASAELYRLACERPEGCVERARELLKMGAEPLRAIFWHVLPSFGCKTSRFKPKT